MDLAVVYYIENINWFEVNGCIKANTVTVNGVTTKFCADFLGAQLDSIRKNLGTAPEEVSSEKAGRDVVLVIDAKYKDVLLSKGAKISNLGRGV